MRLPLPEFSYPRNPENVQLHSNNSTKNVTPLYSKTSFEKNCFSACASTLNMGLINKVDMVCLSPVGYGV